MKEKKGRKIISAVWTAALCCMICMGGIHTAVSVWENMEEKQGHTKAVWQEGEIIWKIPQTESDDLRTGEGGPAEMEEQKEERGFAVPIWKETFFLQSSAVPETSDGYRYEEEFEQVLDDYGQFQALYCEDFSTAIPGLESTGFASGATNQMVPQGICIAGEYMLITAYDKEEEKNSVIYVLSNQDPAERKLLTTLVLPDQNHVGGITCDGSRVWIAKSTTKYLSVISCERIRQAVASGRKTVYLKAYDASLYCGVTASFISYQDQRLWVGTSQSFLSKQGELNVFRMLENETHLRLVRQFTMEIPCHSQGISFLEEDGRSYLLLNVSHGRFRDSELYVYEKFVDDQKAVLRGKLRYRFPPMVEELVSDGSYTYCLFESAATCYSTVKGMKCRYPVDRVCALDNRLLVEG